MTSEPERKLVRAVMSDMLTLAEVERFSNEEQAAVRRMGLLSGEFVLLIETIGNLVQTQEVMEAFQALLGSSLLKARRIATVRDGVLTRMQTRRISKTRSNAEVFDTLAAAETWLFAP